MKYTAVCTSLALTFSLAGAANAALIHAGGDVTLVSATTFDTGIGSSPVTGASDGDTGAGSGNNGQLFTDDPGGFPSDYFVNAPSIVMDMNLGTVYIIDSISFWNRGSYNANSVSSFSAIFSTDSIFGNGDDSALFSFNPAENIGGDQQDFALGTTVSDAQYVRITIDDNYFGTPSAGAGGDRTNFSEFQFNAVPEPSSTALLSLGGLALILRRRK